MVAWRVMFVTMLGRTCPDLCCEVIFSPEEWQSVSAVLSKGDPPSRPPTLGEFVHQIASLGGHLGRKRDGPPGTKTMWIGMQRLRDFSTAWTAFGPR